MYLACVVLQVHVDGDYSLGFDFPPPDAVDLCVVPWFWKFLIFIEFIVGINGVGTPLIP